MRSSDCLTTRSGLLLRNRTVQTTSDPYEIRVGTEVIGSTDVGNTFKPINAFIKVLFPLLNCPSTARWSRPLANRDLSSLI